MLVASPWSTRLLRLTVLLAGNFLFLGGQSTEASVISSLPTNIDQVGVTVTGAAYSTYTGEGYAVGSKGSPYTLATLDGGPFLINSGSDRITITTAQPIYGISFDFEIFPDGTTPNGKNSSPSNSNWPDFTLAADGQNIFTVYGIMPGSTPPTEPGGITVLGLDSNGKTFSQSPNDSSELAPQLIASSGWWNFPQGVTQLEFIDWPPTIGIANVQFNTSPLTAIPEPATLLMLGGALASLGLLGRLRKSPPA